MLLIKPFCCIQFRHSVTSFSSGRPASRYLGNFKAVLAVSATASFNKKSEEVFLVPGKTIAYTLDYFSVLTEMNKVEASYSVYYKDSDGAEKSAKIDFDKTVFMNSAEPVEGEDVFNVYGKTNLVIRQTEKE